MPESGILRQQTIWQDQTTPPIMSGKRARRSIQPDGPIIHPNGAQSRLTLILQTINILTQQMLRQRRGGQGSIDHFGQVHMDSKDVKRGRAS